MTDFFAMMDAEALGELANQMITRARPKDDMTRTQRAELEVLQALFDLEKLRGAVVFARASDAENEVPSA